MKIKALAYTATIKLNTAAPAKSIKIGKKKEKNIEKKKNIEINWDKVI